MTDQRPHLRVRATVRLLSTFVLHPHERLLARAVAAGGSASRTAWEAWCADEGWVDPGSPRGRLTKAVAPLVLCALRRDGIAVDHPARARVHAWQLAELTRQNRYEEIAAATFDELATAGWCPIVLGGTALGALAYDAPLHRHAHDVDLIVARVTPEVAGRLAAVGFGTTHSDGPGRELRFVHRSGLPLVLRAGELRAEWESVSHAELASAATRVRLGGRDVLALSPAHALTHLAVPALTSRRGSEALRAALDVWHLARRATTNDWDAAVAIARRNAVSLAMMVSLAAMEDFAGGRVVPGEVWSSLERAFDGSTRSQMRHLLPRLAGAPRSVGALRRLPVGWATRAQLAWAMACPPARVLASTSGEGAGAGVMGRYARRAARWIWEGSLAAGARHAR